MAARSCECHVITQRRILTVYMHKTAMERLSRNLSIDFFGNIQYLSIYKILISVSIRCFIPFTTFHMISVFIFQVLYRSNWELICLYSADYSEPMRSLTEGTTSIIRTHLTTTFLPTHSTFYVFKRR